MITEISTSKTLNLNFHEDCINKDPNICTKKEETNEYYLRYFSESERKECMNFKQETQSMNDILQFCVEIENSTWFGGAENTYQYWPLNKLNWTDRPYVTLESWSQAVSSRYFVNKLNFIYK